MLNLSPELIEHQIKMAIELANKEIPRAKMYGWDLKETWYTVYWTVMGGIGLFPYSY